MTLAQLDEIRRKSTDAKDALREAQAHGVGRTHDLSNLDDRCRDALVAVIMSVLRENVAQAEKRADRAVRRWIAQGCREEASP